MRYPDFEIVLKKDAVCPCGSGKLATGCHGGADHTNELSWPEADGRVWPIVIELSKNVLTFLAQRSRLLQVTADDPRRRHHAMAAGFYGSVAYRSLKAVTTLTRYGQNLEAMSLVREISEAEIRAEYYACFPEEAHKLIASKHVRNFEWMKEQNTKTLVMKVGAAELARFEKRAQADLLAYPELKESGKLWSEPDLKRMIERLTEHAMSRLPEPNRVDWLERSGGGTDLNAAGAREHLRRTAAARSWIVNRLLSQGLHSTIQMIDFAFGSTADSPLRPFDAPDRGNIHQPIMLAIKSAINVAAAINVVSGHGDLRVNVLLDAYNINKEAIRAASRRSHHAGRPLSEPH